MEDNTTELSVTNYIYNKERQIISADDIDLKERTYLSTYEYNPAGLMVKEIGGNEIEMYEYDAKKSP